METSQVVVIIIKVIAWALMLDIASDSVGAGGTIILLCIILRLEHLELMLLRRTRPRDEWREE